MSGSGRVAGKVACITGAASGIGRGAALRLAAEGAIVVGTDLNEDGGAALVAEIEAAGGVAQFIRHDVTSEDDWQAVVAAIRARWGRLDILVNNAGVGFSGGVTDFALDRWRLMIHGGVRARRWAS